MNVITIGNQVIIIFFIVVIGFTCRKLNILDQYVNKSLAGFILNVTIPCTIISSFHQKLPKEALVEAGQMFVLAVLIHAVAIFIGMILYRNYEPGMKKVLWFNTVFSNCGFMGFPVLDSILGKSGVFYGSVYVAVFNLFVWTFGQMVFSGTKDKAMLKKALLNPGVMAIGLGVMVFLFPSCLPATVSKAIDMMGAVTTPLAMVIIGSSLGEVKISDMFSGVEVYYGIAVRLLLMPALSVLALKAMGISGQILFVSCLLTAMPTAAILVMFAEKFDGDALLASRIAFLSTVLSIVTIPVTTLFL